MVQPSFLGNELRLNSVVAGDQHGSGSIALTNGNALLYWMVGDTEYGRVVTADDHTLGAEFALASTTAASIDSLPGGGFEVSSGGGNSLTTSFYDQNGLYTFGNSESEQDANVTGVLTATAGSDIVFAIRATSGTYTEVEDASGNIVQDLDVLKLNNGSGISAHDSAGHAWNVLAGAGYGSGSLGVATLTGTTISLHIVNMTSFSDVSGPITVAGGAGVDPSTFKLIKLADGNVLASWRNGTTVNAQQYDSAGHTVGALMEATGVSPGGVAAAGLLDGSFMLTWADLIGGSHQIMAETFSSAGVATGAAFQVNDDEAGEHTDPSVVQLGGGDILVGWDYVNGSTVDVDGRLLSLTRPDAVTDVATAASGASTTLFPLINDHDPNGDSISLVSVGTPLHGTAVVSGDSIIYTSAAGYTGVDGFSYTIQDAAGHTDTATSLVLVNSAAARLDTHLQDFNGDGHSDLLWRNDNGSFTEWQFTGNAQETPNATGGTVDPSWHIVSTLDFNGDGSSDILWRNDNGTFTIWDSIDGQFQQNVYHNADVGTGWTIAATGDFNGDGLGDLLWRNVDGTFTEWQSTGTGFTLNVYVDASVSNDWTLVGSADFSGDGKDDMLWRNGHTGAFSIWSSTGTGFTPNTYFDASVDTTWHIAALGDFDGDGKADILWRNDNGAFTEWQSNGSGFTANVYYDATVGTDWQIAATGDFNGDGKTDLMWRNTATGTFTVWDSNGHGFDENVVIDNSVDTHWTPFSPHVAFV